MTATPALVPELDVADLDRSLVVYIDVLDFRCHVNRPEERFAYLIREDVHLMLEEAAGPEGAFTRLPWSTPSAGG